MELGTPSEATLEVMPSSVRHPPKRWRAESSERSQRASRASCCSSSHIPPHPRWGTWRTIGGHPSGGQAPQSGYANRRIHLSLDHLLSRETRARQDVPREKERVGAKASCLRDRGHCPHGRRGDPAGPGAHRPVHVAPGRTAGALGCGRLPGGTHSCPRLAGNPPEPGIPTSHGFGDRPATSGGRRDSIRGVYRPPRISTRGDASPSRLQ